MMTMELWNAIKVSAETATEAADTATATTGGTVATSLLSLLPFVLIILVMYLFMFRPQKKKDEEQQRMRDNIEIGNEIMTVGGILGIVIRKNDDSVVIETGSDKTRLRIKKWAIHENITATEAAQAAAKEKKASRMQKAEEKE